MAVFLKTALRDAATPPGRRDAGAWRHRPAAWLLGAALACLLSGCVTEPKPEPEPPPPPPAPAWTTAYRAPRAASEAEYRHALEQYRSLRSGGQQTLTVAPKAPPRNDYPEFNEQLYLEPAQRILPLDPYARDRKLPAAGHRDHVDGFGDPVNPRGALKPIEQLVYGGEHPESDPPERYRLQPRDAVRIDVRDHAELSGTVTVASDGTLRLPLGGDFVPVRGRTVDEATEKVRAALVPYLKTAPEVRLIVENARGGYYQVFGDVRHPGRYPLGTEPVRASEAVLAANWEALPGAVGDAHRDELGPAFPAAHPRGQFSPPASADLRAVQVYTPHRSQPARSVHNLEPALFQGATGDDPYLRSGQVVFVPSRDPERNPEWARR